VIYPGQAHGILGKDILLEETLDPGRYADYQKAQAVIARMGGRLSHGATLLREFRKPSAIIPDADPSWKGREVHYQDGLLLLIN